MELIDEMKANLPIPACANRELRRLLMENGLSVTPEKVLNIIKVIESGDIGGITCFLDYPENFVISLTLLRVKPDHPLHDKISAYQKKRIRSLSRSKGLRPLRR